MSLLFSSLPCSAFPSAGVEKEEESKVHRQREGQTAAPASIKGRTGALIQVAAPVSLDRDGLLALRARSGQLH